MYLTKLLIGLGALAVFSLPAAQAEIFTAKDVSLKSEVLAKGLKRPWGMAFLPDRSLLISERQGTLRRYANGKVSKPITGLPKIDVSGQGGLLDVAIDPNFAANRFVYLTFSEPGKGGAGTAALRGKLTGTALSQVKIIYRQSKKTSSGRHFGSRLAFAPDGTLFITNGDRGDMDRAQDPFDHAGSLIRINPDGTIPADNPFADGRRALPEIYALGHRNAQGADIHPKTGKIWTVEHGASGGDEINQPEAGKNYGWPVISYGTHYSGGKIGRGTKAKGYEQPKHYWDPSIAPSGLAFYDGALIPGWQGDLLVGALRGRALIRLDLNGNKVIGEERIIDGQFGRIRDVDTGPDGAVYILTDDSDGKLVRLAPVPAPRS